jgi:hypothetical protein
LPAESNFIDAIESQLNGQQKTRLGGFFMGQVSVYLSLISLYSTCLRALGSNFMIDIFSGMVFLFLLVV